MELTRSSLVASGAPMSFWDYAVTHAVDILNRTSGPPNTNASLCQAVAVKPLVAFSKTRLEPRAWVGMILGRSVRSPGAYHVWVPSSGHVVITSDEYFDKTHFPWRNAAQSSNSRRRFRPTARAAVALGRGR
eukprot:6016727-Pleurochrysis_carterae.AAC.1